MGWEQQQWMGALSSAGMKQHSHSRVGATTAGELSMPTFSSLPHYFLLRHHPKSTTNSISFVWF